MKKFLRKFGIGVLALFLLVGTAGGATYNSDHISGWSKTTPNGAVEPPSVLDDALREIKRAVENDTPWNATSVSTTPYNMLDNDSALFVDATSSAITVNLKTASGIEKIIVIKKVDSSANAVTVDAYLSETIEGSTTKTLSTQGETLIIQADGSNWREYKVNAGKLNSQEGAYYLSRTNHTGTQAPSTISPQGSGSTLDADTVDGKNPGSASGLATLNTSSKVAETATLSDSLTMQGEATATSATAPVTLDLGTVTAGDRILVSAVFVLSNLPANSALMEYIQKNSGTATVKFANASTTINNIITNSSASGMNPGSTVVTGVIQVTGSGTLVIKADRNTLYGSSETISAIELYVFFIKKQ